MSQTARPSSHSAVQAGKPAMTGGIGKTPALGERISRLRKSRGLTLAQLSSACALSEATLSRIENGHSAVSAQNLFALSQYLAVDITRFFGDDAAPVMPGMRSLTRKDQGVHQALDRYDAEILCADLSRKDMHPVINTIQARTLAEAGGLSVHEGEEFLYVLEGEVAIHTDLYAPTHLERGDCLYFDGLQQHAYLCSSDKPARILVLVSHRYTKDAP